MLYTKALGQLKRFSLMFHRHIQEIIFMIVSWVGSLEALRALRHVFEIALTVSTGRTGRKKNRTIYVFSLISQGVEITRGVEASAAR